MQQRLRYALISSRVMFLACNRQSHSRIVLPDMLADGKFSPVDYNVQLNVSISDITGMNNHRGDLSLFHVFKALMEERNVGRAADRLGLTQPAASNALNRLRLALNDQLFVRTPTGMKPTQKALDLWPQVHAAVDTLSAMMFPARFDPAEATTTFRVAVTDALRHDLTISLSVAFAAAAPKAQLQFHHHTNLTSGLALQNNDVDCSIGMFPRVQHGMNVIPLLRDDYVCVMRADNPLARGDLTLQGFTGATHILSKPTGIRGSTIDYWLALHGLGRKIAVVVTYFSDALGIVAVSDLIACVPERHLDAETMSSLDLVARPLPFETERILYKLVWHERTDNAAEHIWLRSLIVEQFPVAKEIAELDHRSPVPGL